MKSWWLSPLGTDNSNENTSSRLGPVNSNENTSNLERDPEIVVDVKSALDIEPDMRPECCIYRVPQKLRKVNEDAYAPMLISIGPFHHGNENLKKMEELKVRYLMEACYRTNKSQMDLARFVREQELKIRHCYAENFHEISSEDFVKMILLDSIFIIEHMWTTKQKRQKSSDSNDTSYPCECLLRVQDLCLITCKKEHRNEEEEDNQESGDPEEADVEEKESPWLSYHILQDLLLLENQVPFFVLKELYDSAYQDLLNVQENEDKSFHKFVHDYFEHFWKDYGLNCSFDDHKKILRRKQVRHLTDFLRYFIVPSKRKFGKSIKRLPCATKLAEAGVEFRKVKNRRLLDIKFRKNWLLGKCPCLNLSWILSCFPCFKCMQNMEPVLELQSFKVGDATECVIRNLTAFEQCHYPREAIICNYIVLLDHLINTAEDVDLLVEKKIIVNWLGNNEAVATLINKLCHQIVEGNRSCYYELSEQIRRHYSNCWSKLIYKSIFPSFLERRHNCLLETWSWGALLLVALVASELCNNALLLVYQMYSCC